MLFRSGSKFRRESSSIGMATYAIIGLRKIQLSEVRFNGFPCASLSNKKLKTGMENAIF